MLLEIRRYFETRDIESCILYVSSLQETLRKIRTQPSLETHISSETVESMIVGAEKLPFAIFLKLLDLLIDLAGFSGEAVPLKVLNATPIISRCFIAWEALGNKSVSELILFGSPAENSALQDGKLIIVAFFTVLGFFEVGNLMWLSTPERLKLEDIRSHMASEKLRILGEIWDRLGDRLIPGDKADLREQITSLKEELDMSNFRKSEVVRLEQRTFESFICDHLQNERSRIPQTT